MKRALARSGRKYTLVKALVHPYIGGDPGVPPIPTPEEPDDCGLTNEQGVFLTDENGVFLISDSCAVAIFLTDESGNQLTNEQGTRLVANV